MNVSPEIIPEHTPSQQQMSQAQFNPTPFLRKLPNTGYTISTTTMHLLQAVSVIGVLLSQKCLSRSARQHPGQEKSGP